MKTSKILALLFVILAGLVLQVVTMIYGWGVQPRSWTVIILSGFVGTLFIHALGKKVMDDQ